MTDDYISRQAVLDSFWKLDIELRPCAIDTIVNMINNLPHVTPKEKTVIEALEKVKEEIKQIRLHNGYIDVQGLTIIKVLEIIDKHLSEMNE